MMIQERKVITTGVKSLKGKRSSKHKGCSWEEEDFYYILREGINRGTHTTNRTQGTPYLTASSP